MIAASRRSASARSRTTDHPEYAREVAFQKITNRVRGTLAAAERLGVG
jgi:hypothetical protein